MEKENNEFHMNRLCEITDVNCWKTELQKNMNCDKNDKECWKSLAPTLPCQMGDVECWKKQFPEIPCEFHDKECWEGLLPSQEMPCKVDDKECWDTYRGKTSPQGPSELQSEKQAKKKEDQLQKMEQDLNFFQAYGFGII